MTEIALCVVFILTSTTIVIAGNTKCPPDYCNTVLCPPVIIDCIQNAVLRTFPELCRCCPKCYGLIGKLKKFQ